MFRVNQRVVCVEPHDNPPAHGGVKAGEIYTVREIGLTVIGSPGIRLVEITLWSGPGEIGRYTRDSFTDVFYRASRFRPIVERKTDISALKALLLPNAKILEGV